MPTTIQVPDSPNCPAAGYYFVGDGPDSYTPPTYTPDPDGSVHIDPVGSPQLFAQHTNVVVFAVAAIAAYLLLRRKK